MSNTIIIGIAVVAAAMLSEAFFAGTELAVIATDRLKNQAFKQQGNRGAVYVDKLKQAPGRLLATTLFGTNLSTVISSTVAGLLFIDAFGRKGELYAALIMPPAIMLFAEVIPKSISQSRPGAVSRRLAFPLFIASKIFYPAVVVLEGISSYVSRRVGSEQPPTVTRKNLLLLLNISGRRDEIKAGERRMIRRIFQFSDADAEEVMVPLIDVKAIASDATALQAAETFSNNTYSRMPVFEERVDKIVGILHAFELLRKPDPATPVSALMQSAAFFPETAPADRMLFEMRKKGLSMAVIVDEYGGAQGIVTLEDLLEEVVGEIEDETDIEDPQFKRIDASSYLISARMEIDEINDLLKLGIPRGDYETLGGFVLDRLERIPDDGEAFREGNLIFIVRGASDRAIENVEVRVRRARRRRTR